MTNAPGSSLKLMPELWLMIFDFATYTPTLLDPDVYSSSFCGSPHISFNMRQIQPLEEAFRTKLAITRVSRQWRALAIPLLYQCLIIRKGSDISLFLNALLAYEKANGLSPGSWVKRLDMVFAAPGHFPLEHDTALLAELLRILPNLAVLHIAMIFLCNHSWPPAVVDAFVSTCSPSLKVLYFYRGSAWVGQSGLVRMVCAAPSLRILVPGDSMCWPPKSLSLNDINCDNVTILELGSSDYAKILANMSFPSLRDLIILGGRINQNGYSQFLQVHGERLMKLSTTADINQETMDIVKGVCTRLLILELRAWSQPRVNPQDLDLPLVRELWLQFNYPSQFSAMLSFVLECLVSAPVPRLETVRVMLSDRDTATYLRQAYAPLLDDWHARTAVLLLDYEGIQL